MLNKFFNGLKDTIWNVTHKDAAKMLIGMGAIGFALSSMAQCFAIKINDRIDSRKKNFLLMQEAADGAVNIGLFLAITSGVWKISDKILTALGICKKNQPLSPTGTVDPVKSGGRILTTMIASVAACNVITPLVRNLIAGKIRSHKDKIEYKSRRALIDVKKLKDVSSFKNFDNWAVKAVEERIKKPKLNYPITSSSNRGNLKV